MSLEPSGVELLDRLKQDADVPCGSCRLCCQGNSLVMLIPENGDDVSSYETTVQPLPGFPILEDTLFLKIRPNGDCFYLTDKGCGIHGRAPFMCRIFDCRETHKMYTKTQREAMIREGILNGEVLRRGAILLHQQKKSK